MFEFTAVFIVKKTVEYRKGRKKISSLFNVQIQKSKEFISIKSIFMLNERE